MLQILTGMLWGLCISAGDWRIHAHRQRSRPQSSSASRFTAGASAFFILMGDVSVQGRQALSGPV